MKAPNCWYQFIFNNCTLLKELKLKQKEVLIYVESVFVFYNIWILYWNIRN